LDWPKGILEMQKNWIGRSEGIDFKHKVKDMDIEFEVFDSVPQTFMAQTYVVIAPEHLLVEKLVKGTEYEKPVMAFVEKIKRKKLDKNFDIEKEKEGIFTGRYSENYMGTGRDLPIWVASFVLVDYGTGIVGSSAHDVRDFEFAKKYDLPLHPVMFPSDPVVAEKVKNLEYCYHHAPEGILKEPTEFTGRRWDEVRQSIIDYIEKKGFGRKVVNYHLRDWIFSRQRYWGEPIPMAYCKRCADSKLSWWDLHKYKVSSIKYQEKDEINKKEYLNNIKLDRSVIEKVGERVNKNKDKSDEISNPAKNESAGNRRHHISGIAKSVFFFQVVSFDHRSRLNQGKLIPKRTDEGKSDPFLRVQIDIELVDHHFETIPIQNHQ